MPDVPRFAEVNHFLDDAGRVIGNALEAFGDDHQAKAARHRNGILNRADGDFSMGTFKSWHRVCSDDPGTN
jgi:hypothetical protein